MLYYTMSIMYCLFCFVFLSPGLEYVITQLKSVVLSLGVIDRHLGVEQAVLLSRLEEEYQVERWHSCFGNVLITVCNVCSVIASVW